MLPLMPVGAERPARASSRDCRFAVQRGVPESSYRAVSLRLNRPNAAASAAPGASTRPRCSARFLIQRGMARAHFGGALHGGGYSTLGRSGVSGWRTGRSSWPPFLRGQSAVMSSLQSISLGLFFGLDIVIEDLEAGRWRDDEGTRASIHFSGRERTSCRSIEPGMGKVGAGPLAQLVVVVFLSYAAEKSGKW
jgi:hypothetical protein